MRSRGAGCCLDPRGRRRRRGRRGPLGRRRAILTWGLSLGAYGALIAAIYPSIQRSIEKIAKTYAGGLKEAFGVQAMNTVEGYIHAEVFSLIVPLALGLLAYLRSVRLPARPFGAEERGHLDTILSLPISRTVLIAGAYIVAALACAGIMTLTGLMTFLGGTIAGTHISLGLGHCRGDGRVAARAVLRRGRSDRYGSATQLANGQRHRARHLVAMYALDLAGRLAPSLGAIHWVSAFRYYGAPMRHGLDPAAFIGLAGAGVLLLIVAAGLLERRDVLH